MVLGLTGGIACGKSTACDVFRELGVKVYDADAIAREVLNTDENKNKVVELLGTKVLDKNGQLDRKEIKKIVFNDKNLLEGLNNIVHPEVIRFFEEIRRENKKNYKEIIVFDIPLLFEKNMQTLCDQVITIYVDKETQIKRAKERDGMKRGLVLKIMSEQMPTREKLKLSDYKVKNDDVEEMKHEIINIYTAVTKILKGEYV